MDRNKAIRTWNMRLIAFVLTMILAISPLLSGTHVQASTALNVEEYKGDRAQADWLVPKEDGKVFAGWYQDTEFKKVYTGTTGNAYPKFVDEKVLTVKKQLKSDVKSADITSIRFLTAIDSLMFKGVTFNVKVAESSKEWTVTETTAYSSMKVDGITQPKLPSDADVFNTTDAKYFVAHSFTGIPKAVFGQTFAVTPSWETMDGTIVKGEKLIFTVNEEMLRGSLFADKVTVNGVTAASAVQNWDISEIDQNILNGSYAKGSSLKPMYFTQAGKTMLLHATMEYATVFESGKSYQNDLMGGLYVSDGTNTGYFGVRQHGVVYSPWLEWISNAWPYDVLAKWEPAHMKAQIDIALKDGVFHIYVDGLHSTTLELSKIMPNTAADADLAFGLTMHADKDCDIKFSDIKFTTSADEVDVFLNPPAPTVDPLFSESLTVNGTTVTSGTDNWVYNGADKIATGTHTTNNVFYMAPLYLKETGNTMLLQMTITNVSDPIKDQPLAGIYITDGTNKGGFGLYSNLIKYGQWLDKSAGTLDYAVLTQWDTNKSVKLEIALKDGEFYIYLNEVYVTKLAVNSVMFTGTSSGELAFGLTMRSEKGQPTSLQFSNINFTTDADEVNAYLNPPLFAETVTINGTTVASAVNKWDMSQEKDNILRATSDLGSTLQPIYFEQTGNTMLLQTTVTVTSKTAGDPMAGIWLHDGSRRAFIGVRGAGLFYSPAAASWNGWYGDGGYWPTQELAPGWGGAAKADIDIVIKDGTLTVYVDDIYSKSIPLTDVMPDLAVDANLAFGLVAYTDGTRAYDMTFSDIQFTTNVTKVDAFIASKTATNES